MAVLSDYDISKYQELGSIGISPYSPAQLNPASYDVRLDSVVSEFDSTRIYDLKNEDLDKGVQSRIFGKEGFVLEPDAFILGCTEEVVSLPLDLSCQVNGKSSLGRLGLLVHATAGYIDPGFSGQITLEVKNLLKAPVVIYPGMRIAQLVFTKMASAPMNDYGNTGHYQHQKGPTPSRFKLDKR